MLEFHQMPPKCRIVARLRPVIVAAGCWLILAGGFTARLRACDCPYQDDGPVDYCTYPGTGCAPDYHEENGCCCYDYSPVLLDILGDGFQLTDAENGVSFDFTGPVKSCGSPGPRRARTTPGSPWTGTATA